VNEIALDGSVVRLTRLTASGDPAPPSAFLRAPPAADCAEGARAPAGATAQKSAASEAEPTPVQPSVAAQAPAAAAASACQAPNGAPALATPGAVGAQPPAGGAQTGSAPAAAGARGGAASGAAEAAAAQPQAAVPRPEATAACERQATTSAAAPAAPAPTDRGTESDLAEFEAIAGAENAATLRQLLLDIAAFSRRRGRPPQKVDAPEAELDVSSFDKLQVGALATAHALLQRNIGASCAKTVLQSKPARGFQVGLIEAATAPELVCASFCNSWQCAYVGHCMHDT